MIKIKRIKFYNHNILGDLDLDFCDSNGNPYNNVILAGENGSGKSTVLNFIYNLFNSPQPFELQGEQVEIYMILNDKQMSIFESESITFQSYINNSYSFKNEIKITINENKDYLGHNDVKAEILLDDLSGYMPLSNRIFGGFSEEIFKVVFSDVEVNYNARAINSTSSLEIDNPEFKVQKSSENLATEITQLLVDLEAMDNSEFAHWASGNIEAKVSDGVIDKRMKRFKNAFSYMFESKNFKRVENRNDEKHIIFEENGNEITINNLSSGEKQIVFRGSFLLRNKLTSESAIILVDEPEISLHPKWQKKIINYYKNLFKNDKGIQTSQIFFVTHSPFVIHNIDAEMDEIIVLEKKDGKVCIQESPTFYGWKEEEAVKHAFGITLNVNRQSTIIFVEGITDEKYIKKAFDIFGFTSSDMIVKWIGREDRGHKFTGDTALNQAKEYLLSNKDLYNNRFILFYDSDTNANEEDFAEENLYIRKAPFNDEAEIFKKGSENLLTIPEGFEINRFYREKINLDEYGGKVLTNRLNKVSICDYICDEASLEEQKIWFSKFKELVIPKIEEVVEKETV